MPCAAGVSAQCPVQPVFKPPEGLEPALPPWRPQVRMPVFQAPAEPRPVGFLRGAAPLLVLDVSGTLSPVLRGRFGDELAAAALLLGPAGEMGTQRAFDVIAFATGAHSWSVDYQRRARMLQEGRVMLAGRQVRTRPATAAAAFVPQATCITAHHAHAEHSPECGWKWRLADRGQRPVSSHAPHAACQLECMRAPQGFRAC
jgi:hypothetical protein